MFAVLNCRYILCCPVLPVMLSSACNVGYLNQRHQPSHRPDSLGDVTADGQCCGLQGTHTNLQSTSSATQSGICCRGASTATKQPRLLWQIWWVVAYYDASCFVLAACAYAYTSLQEPIASLHAAGMHCYNCIAYQVVLALHLMPVPAVG